MAERKDPIHVRAETLKFTEPPPIRGLSRQIVADLWDILDKRGQLDPNRNIVEFSSSTPGKSIILSKAPEGATGFLVQKNRRVKIEDFVQIRTNQISIGWDKHITAEYAKSAILEVDSQLRFRGQIDSKGQRQLLTPEESLKPSGKKLKIDEIFHSPNVTFITEASTPEGALRNFDQPERLEVVYFSGRVAVVRTKPDPYERLRQMATLGSMMNHVDFLNIRNRGATQKQIQIGNILFMQTLLEHGQSFWTFDDTPQEVKMAVHASLTKKLIKAFDEETIKKLFDETAN